MKKFLLMLMFFSTCLFSASIAQERSISGKITDGTTGEPIPGANVVEKGTTNGTVTDLDGNYKLSVSDGATIVVSFIGYANQEVAVGSRSVVDITMEVDVTELSEVVVVGYGTQEKKEITSAVTSVSAEEFNNGNINNPSQLLQGKVAGLSVVRPSGDLNADPEIRLRGLSTFGANSQPLVVIDGVIGAPLSSVDPNDIATFDILKDGSAAAIYGARGSSGVILITTKSGSGGVNRPLEITFNGFVTVDQVENSIDVLSADEFVALGGRDFGSDTNWLEEVTRDAVSYVGNLNLSGGSANGNYFASVNYRNNEGISEGIDFNRINTRVGTSQRALDGRLRFDASLAYNSRSQNNINREVYRYASIYNPTAPIFERDLVNAPDGESDTDRQTRLFNAERNFGGYFQRPEAFDFINPVGLANQQRFTEEISNFIGNYKVAFDVIDNLTVTFNYAQNFESRLRGNQWDIQDIQVGFGAGGSAERQLEDNKTEIFTGTVNYLTSFDDFDLSFLLGVERQDRSFEGFGARTRNVIFDEPGFNGLGFGGVRFGNNTNLYSYRDEDRLNSAFFRANGNWDNTVFLSASVRQEAFSGFGDNNKIGYFPAFSAGVEIANLTDLGIFNSLKFRGSYGVTGNLPPRADLAIARQEPGQRIDLDGDVVTTPNDTYIIPTFTQNSNPELKWETKTEYNIGFDFSLFDGKLTGATDYYRRDIADLLYAIDVPIGAPNVYDPGEFNFANRTWANVGELTAGGFEFAATYNGLNLGPVAWTPSINFTYYDKTQIESFDAPFDFIRNTTLGSPGQNDNPVIWNVEGETLGNFYGPTFAGVDELGNYILQNNEDIENWSVLGNGLPQFEFGFSNTFTYQNFDFNFLLRGVFGHDIINSYRAFYENRDAGSTTWNSVDTELADDRLTGTPTWSSLYVEDGGFIRLDNAQLGYNFNMTNNSTLSRLRIYIAGQNLFTITNYTGVDPEVKYRDIEIDDDFNANLSPGIERRGSYFTTRSYTFGVLATLK